MRTLQQRRNLMLAVLSVLQIDWPPPEPGGIAATRSWLDSWPGVGILVTGLNAQGYDIELRQLAGHWRANVYWTGQQHSVVRGSGWESTPWASLQAAAWQALTTPDPVPGK